MQKRDTKKRVEKIKKLMSERHESPIRIAKIMGVSNTFMYNILNGYNPLPDILGNKIEKYLNLVPALSENVLKNLKKVRTYNYQKKNTKYSDIITEEDLKSDE